MRCSKVEKYLCSLSDSPADQKVETLVREHIRTCSRCGQIESFLKKMDRISSDVPDFERISEPQIEEIVSQSIRNNKTFSNKPGKIKNLFSFPKIAVAGFTVIFLAAAVLFIKPFINGDPFKLNYRNTAAYLNKDQNIKSVSGDSVLSFGQNCTMLLRKNSRCTIIKSEEKVVIVELQHGEIFVSAAKGMYDTIAVRCGTFKVYATGTHFKVEHFDKQIRVSVLEGKVKTVHSTSNETDVSALETLTFQKEDSSVTKGFLSSNEQDVLVTDFAVFAAANTRLGLKRAISEKSRENLSGNLFSVNVKSSNQKREFRSDSAAARQLAIAESMVKKGRFRSAVPVLEYYLKIYDYNTDSAWFSLGACYSYIRRYNEAADAYKRVINECVDEQLVEAALHRRNKILFLKLKLNDEARCGSQSYLKMYPQGKWREEEFYYVCRLALADNDIKSADSLTGQFLKEYPHDCRAYELLEEIRTKSKMSLNQ
jgi:TolA-binding protein